MAILGTGGILELSREWPEVMALRLGAINFSTSTVALSNDGYWTGDRVLFTSANGIPFDLNGDGYADCPEGHGIYRGSIYELGPARDFYTGPETNENGPHYRVTSIAPPPDFYYYNRAQETGFATQFDAYGYMDQLDRMRLMTSATDAYNDNSAAAVALRSVDCGNFVISRYSTDSDYTSALNTAANAIKPLTLQNQSEKLSAVITPPSELTTYPNDPNNRGWLVQCDLQEWAFSIDAANLDMTAIGETFGENAKSLVRGAGSLTFLVDQRLVDGEQTSMTLLRLVTLTEKQAKSSAKFHIYKDRTPVSPQVGTTAYYGCDILLTNTRINVRADDIITGTADFVATGEVGLKFEP